MAIIAVSLSNSIASGRGAITFFPDHAQTITPSDTNTFSAPVTVYCGNGGVVMVDTAGGEVNVPFTVPPGVAVPVRVLRVYATGTTATLMMACS